MEPDMRAVPVPVGREVLFRVFSRFENALKEAGFFERGRNDEPKISWDKFAIECLGVPFFMTEKLPPVLSEKPPSSQIVEGASLIWRTTDPPETIEELFVQFGRGAASKGLAPMDRLTRPRRHRK